MSCLNLCNDSDFNIDVTFLSVIKYGAFLAVVALLELGAGASVYAYRKNLNEGFDQGLNESMEAYGQDQSKTSHIDVMQTTVSILTPSSFPFVSSLGDSRYSNDGLISRMNKNNRVCFVTQIEQIYYVYISLTNEIKEESIFFRFPQLFGDRII